MNQTANIDGKSQMSKTQNSGFWNNKQTASRSMFNPGGTNLFDHTQVGFELQNVQDKLSRGISNSVMMKQLKAQKVKDYASKVPDVEYLRKMQADENYG